MAGRTWRSLASITLLVLVLATSVNDTIYGQIQSKTNQLNGLNGSIAGTRTRLGQMVARKQALDKEIAALNGKLAQVAAQIAQENGKLHALGLQIQQIKVRLAAKEAEVQQHVIELGERTRAMYKSGQTNGLELLLTAVNFNDLLNRMVFFADIVRAARNEVDELQKERRQIENMKADMDDKYAQQNQVVNQIKAQQAQLQKVRAQVASDQAQVAAIVSEFQRELQQMEAQRQQVQAQLQSLLAEAARAGSTGHFIWPMGGVITQGFGCTPYPFEIYDPSCPTLHFHTGIDIATSYGTPVHASDGGIVHNLSMWCGGGLCGYGYYVIIVHRGGFASLYGHLSGYAAPDGSQVGQGQVIGYEGSSGNSTGAHLHFEIDINGQPVNPLAYLP